MTNVGWPYGRRDGYRDRSRIPADYRNAARRRGLRPFDDEPCAMGGRYCENDNGVFPFGTRNGVLTAVEDFAAEKGLAIEIVGGFEPLAILERGGTHAVASLGARGFYAAAAAARRAAVEDALRRLQIAIVTSRPASAEAMTDVPVVVPLATGDVLRDALRCTLTGHALFAQLLRRVGAILDGAGAAWSVVEGTLLGLERHRGFIPHDDDVDIAISASDVARVRAAVESAGLTMNEHVVWPGIGMTYAIGLEERASRDLGLWHCTPAIDVFPIAREANEILERARLDALESRPFFDFTVRAPRAARQVTLERFGASALETCSVWSRDGGAGNATPMTLASYAQVVVEEGYVAPTTQALA